MRISELQHGDPSSLQLASPSGDLPVDLGKGREVRLGFLAGTNEATLSVQFLTVAVCAADAASHRHLEALRQADPARLCWIVARQDQPGGTTVTVQVHRFRSRVEWPEAVSFGVDERVVERVGELAGGALSPDGARQWLTEQVVFPPAAGGGLPRAVATGSPDSNGRFRLLGARVAVDVSPHGGGLRVEGVVTTHGRGRGFRPPEFLIEARLSFVDATLLGQLRQSVRAQIEQLVSEADSYLALWERYQGIERENLIRRARELGVTRYRTFEALPSGLWRFQLSDPGGLARLGNHLSAAGPVDVEADREPPAELLEDVRAPHDPGRGARSRSAGGTLERVSVDRREILVRPLDEESDVLPPRAGVLYAALQGDRTRLERREQAVRRLKSADARLPQLGLILEGACPFVRRTDRVRTFTAAARRAFVGEPTAEQRQAIDIAVNTPDLVLIQGPPGTGKTKVIRAIAARLSELSEERSGVAGRTLLTSFQHEAVDNAASGSRVFGLPPVRFGGRRGDHSAGADQVERWAAQAREHVEARLAELPEERPLALYRSVRDRVATYASGQLPGGELKSLLEELVDLPAGHLPTALWERLNELRLGPDRLGPAGALEQALLTKVVRGLRTGPQAFADDGPRRARQALAQLEPLLTDQERDLLARAAGTPPATAFAELPALSSLRDALLDRLDPGAIPGDLRRANPVVTDVLNSAVAALHARVRSSEGGVADALQEYAAALRLEPQGVRRLLEHYSTVYAATCQQAVTHPVVTAKGVDHADLEFENVIVDEAARANPLDLFIPMSLAKRRIILVGDHRQLPHLLDPDVEAALKGSVREQEQHALKESLFQRLFERLPRLSEADTLVRVVTLRDQYRMHPALGTFISDTFYKPHGEAFRSPRPEADYAHALPGYLRAGRPVCAAWRDIPRQEGEERRGRSKARSAEARWIAGELRRLLVEAGAEVSVGVISFYGDQVEEIMEHLVAVGLAVRDPDGGGIEIAPQWRTLERADGSRDDRLRVGTVDALQGKEFDVVFLSVTRSNSLPASTEDERRAKFGHLMLENRLCVAMSRQRLLLVAVGDRAMFETGEAREATPALAGFLALCGGQHGLVS